MRARLLPALCTAALASLSLHAQDLASTCHASSSYDVTLNADRVVFDRAAPAPTRVELRQGELLVDGLNVRQSAENQDRLALFERQLRALAPKVRSVAKNGVDLAVAGMRDEAASLGLGADTRAQLDERLDHHAIELKQRIASSNSTHDLQGDIATRYENEIAADLAPLVAGDLAQQAVSAAMSGDLQAAADLRDRGAGLATDLQPRMQQRMQALRPQIAALCPAIRRLAELQQGVRGSDNRPLGLLNIDP